jgi:hypothetical protein
VESAPAANDRSQPLNRFPTALTAWSLVALITLTGVSTADAVVLCIGSDGHVDVESAFETCCLTDGPGNRTETTLVDPCTGCSDIELDTVPRIQEKHRLDSPHAHTSIRVETALNSETRTTESHPAGGDEYPHLAAMSTVVLLT